MQLRRILSLCLLLCAGSALADTPAPTGLARLAALLPGTWTTTGETYDTKFTKAGPVGYTSNRDCWFEGAELKCVFVVNRKLQLLSIFDWDAAEGIYHENQITVQGPSPGFTVYVKGNVWTYLQDGQDKAGNVYHTRIVKTYASPTHVDITTEYSLDGKTWVLYEKASETLVDAGG